jgi:sporulation protein YlmC with PRC-barrel domain
MNTKIFATVSVLTLVMVMPAYAAENTQPAGNNTVRERSQNQQKLPHYTEEQTKRGLENTKENVSDAADDAIKAVKDTYDDIKASLIGDDATNDNFSTITIDSRQTANGMIGKTVYNQRTEAVGTLHDILVDRNGQAQKVIVADGEMWGMGKKVAFNYDLVTRRNQDGDIIAPISEATTKQAVAFSYDKKDVGKDVFVIPADTYSVRELLSGDLVNARGENVANVDNISFLNGRANQLIVGFDKVLGIVGGKKAAIAYGDPQLVRDGTGYDFKLSSNRTAQLEAYKKAIN